MLIRTHRYAAWNVSCEIIPAVAFADLDLQVIGWVLILLFVPEVSVLTSIISLYRTDLVSNFIDQAAHSRRTRHGQLF